MTMSKNIFLSLSLVKNAERVKINGFNPFVLWLTGLSGSGKSTIAYALERKLFDMGYGVYVLDGDNIRHGLSSDLDFSAKARDENIRRSAEVSKILVGSGIISIVSLISPKQRHRDNARSIIQDNNFATIYINRSLSACEKQDSKGLYNKAAKGEIKNFTGIDSLYEPPKNPDIVLETESNTVEDSIDKVVSFLFDKGWLKK